MGRSFSCCWRRSSFRTMRDKPHLKSGDIYQFGVFTGDSMRLIAQELCNLDIKVNNFFGFDIFTGMPPEEGEELMNDDWKEGTFNVVKEGHRFGIESTDVKDIVDEIEAQVSEVFFQNNKPITGEVKVFDGLVQETLTVQNLSKYNLRQAMYVDVDFDLYSSSKVGLEFLTANGIIGPNTVVGYDDWGGKPGYDTFATGESRAHKEVFNDRGINANMSLITLGVGRASSNVYSNVINSDTYSNIIANKPDLPDWKWGDQECIQSVWFIDPSQPVPCGAV